jgi:glycosyltransferase involved in cell wall biosynthesis
VARAAARLGFDVPVLWVNDSSYATLVAESGWPAVYDVTDDWLLGHYPPRELKRLQRNDAALLDLASEVVVCSPALEAARGRSRSVHLIPNGVDVVHIRTPAPRPPDLPQARVALYTGTLSGGRLDVALCADLAERLAPAARLVLVGPNACSADESDRLSAAGAVLLGPRPYADMPAYLQHADVLVVPHRVNPFTESLDPIKAREIVAVGRPAVSTPVAGFRDLRPPVKPVERDAFVSTVLDLMEGEPMPAGPGPMTSEPGSWAERAAAFLQVLQQAARVPRVSRTGTQPLAEPDN